jgi:hypothetical protein
METAIWSLWPIAVLSIFGCNSGSEKDNVDTDTERESENNDTDSSPNTDSHVDTDSGGDTGTDEQPQCGSLDPDKCNAREDCMTVSASPISSDRLCYEAERPVECLDVGDCDTALGMAVDEAGQCWYFTCLYDLSTMSYLNTENERVEACGTNLDNLAACDGV